MTRLPVPRIALEPAGIRSWLADAIIEGGGEIVGVADAEAVVWTVPAGRDDLRALLDANRGIRWVQLPWAGVEPFEGIFDHDHIWTSGKGVYAEPVAEHILTLALAGLRGLDTYANATSWMAPKGRNLLGANVVILGAGGICTSLLRLLGPFGCDITVVRKRAIDVDGAHRTIALDELDGALATADLVVIALALTPETTGLFDRRRLSAMLPTAWLVNLGRGAHIVTDDLVDVLSEGLIGGAAIDVTDPEPLPDGHPLWTEERCLITPHVGNTPEMARPLLRARVAGNVARFARGEALVGLVDPDLGY